MAGLPPHDHVVFDIAKLRDYCLDEAHLRGRHKARVFRRALDIGRQDATWLRHALLEGLPDATVEMTGADGYGTRWRADIAVSRQDRHAVVRTAWLLRNGTRELNFLTCWVL